MNIRAHRNSKNINRIFLVPCARKNASDKDPLPLSMVTAVLGIFETRGWVNAVGPYV